MITYSLRSKPSPKTRRHYLDGSNYLLTIPVSEFPQERCKSFG